MTAIRQTIFAAIASALASPATSAVEIEVMASADPISFPALHIVDDGQSREMHEAGASRYSLSVSIEGYVEGAGGAAAHAQLNQLYADTVRAVMALIDTVSSIEDIFEGDLRTSVAPLAEARRLAFAQDFAITFVTRRGEPESI